MAYPIISPSIIPGSLTIILSDSSLPSVTSFAVPSIASTLTVPVTNLTATDNVGVVGYIVTETSTAPSPTAIGWSATAQTTYTFTTAGSKTLYAWAKDAAGNVSAAMSASVTITLIDPSVRYSIWSDATIPSQPAATDGQPLELGVKLQADVEGYITGLRFYKGEANIGTHVGNLWTRTGTLLASATFTDETASGWQEVLFAAPVAIQAGTTYVASYHSPSGYYAEDLGYFATDDYTPPLRALANGEDGGNGVFKYGASGFPTQTWNSNNYWVDVVFSPGATGDAASPTVTSFSVPANANTFTVPITIFTATDNVGVVGYLVTETSTTPGVNVAGWSTMAQTSYTFSTVGSKTLYAWAKDAAGNVSASMSATVAITVDDITQPIVTSFMVPVMASALTVAITEFTATDNVGVVGYLVTESSEAPSPTVIGWSATPQTSYTFETAGSKTLYAWAKDAAENVSASMSATVAITVDDITQPVVTSFMVPTTASTLTVAITEFTATDNVEVVGYLVTESVTAPSPIVTGWSAAPQASYTFATAGSKTLYAWAKDAAGNVSASMSASVSITLSDPSVRYSIWSDATIPSQPGVTDGQSLELGVKFKADVDGYITGLRFYKGGANTGMHVGNLWTRTGTLLVSATFIDETASGWQEMLFAVPIAVQADTTYVASYHSPSGYFAVDHGYFATDDYNPPLRALANGEDGGNGVFKYGASGFPTQTWNSNNYWVDVIFGPGATGDADPPTVTSFSVPATAIGPTVAITEFAATDNVGVVGYLVTESSIAPSPTVTGWSATPQTSYTFATAGGKTLYAWAKDAAGNVSASMSASVTITPSDPSVRYSIWSDATIPGQPAITDGQPLELGVKFQADVDGYITGLRFYKGAANTGTHVGSFWTRTGTLLVSATFTDETASGWQEVLFDAPIAIQAGTTYVASYYSPSGYYAEDPGYFATDDYTPPLRALADGEDGGNGLFKYGASGFPTQTWSSNNYWVDVIFSP